MTIGENCFPHDALSEWLRACPSYSTLNLPGTKILRRAWREKFHMFHLYS